MQLLFIYYNLIFNLHEFIFYSIYTTLPLLVYSRVLGYFWLSRLKLKKQKTLKTIKNKKQNKNKFLILKTIGFSTPDLMPRCLLEVLAILHNKLTFT